MPDAVTTRVVGDAERQYWDDHVQCLPHVHPLNAFDWGLVRATDGWRAIHVVAEAGQAFRGALLLLAKKLPAVPYSILYAPKGPICCPDDEDAIVALHARVCELARTHRAIFLRMDPNVEEGEGASLDRILSSLNYRHLEQRWTFWNSPRDVYRIDLARWPSAEALLESLDRDTRRCIRKAAKEGVVLETGSEEADLQRFYEIFAGFSVGKGFMARGYRYQKRLWESYVRDGRGRLVLARYRGGIIGGLLCIVFGRKCLAMHMGTPYEYHKLQTYYAYVWESIRWAKELGCTWYSFRGVGTTPGQEAFKRKFGPAVVRLVGYYDYPFRPRLYDLFGFAEFTVLPAAWPVIVKTRRRFRPSAQPSTA